MQHITVLLHEAVEALNLQPDSTIVDATFGGGGHAREIIGHLTKDGVYIGIDADASALEAANLPETEATVHLVHNNFSHIGEICSSLQISTVNGVLADLGWRMEQFSGSNKGFSFQNDEPLLMTYGDSVTYSFTAADIVNEWEEHVIADVLYGYAEERYARRIAKAIVQARKVKQIETTSELVTLVEQALPRAARHGKINPATKTFQALRIAVNDELGVLEQFIKTAFALLAPGGRLAIITFHSIEDRVVKHSFRELHDAGLGHRITKKPIIPTTEEVTQNPRARSAKLRIIEKQ